MYHPTDPKNIINILGLHLEYYNHMQNHFREPNATV